MNSAMRPRVRRQAPSSARRDQLQVLLRHRPPSIPRQGSYALGHWLGCVVAGRLGGAGELAWWGGRRVEESYGRARLRADLDLREVIHSARAAIDELPLEEIKRASTKRGGDKTDPDLCVEARRRSWDGRVVQADHRRHEGEPERTRADTDFERGVRDYARDWTLDDVGVRSGPGPGSVQRCPCRPSARSGSERPASRQGFRPTTPPWPSKHQVSGSRRTRC